MLKGRHAQRYVLPPDKRFEISLNSAHPSAPFLSPFGYLVRKLMVEKDRTDQLVTGELRDEHTKATFRNRIFDT